MRGFARREGAPCYVTTPGHGLEESFMKSRFVHVIGTRPNIPKAAPVIRALNQQQVDQLVVHTGQHYDDALSASLLRDLGMPEPAINLGVGSGSHAQQIARVIESISPVLVNSNPTSVIVYGDVNSTLAATLAAVHLGLPVAHVEAGLRSHDMSMPEEINRRMVDHASAQLFATCEDAVGNLAHEGIEGSRIYLVGNPMIDSLRFVQNHADLDQERDKLKLPSEYALVTLHRPSNVDDPERVAQIGLTLNQMAECIPIVLPAHPRARQGLEAVVHHAAIRLIDPLGYGAFLATMETATLVLTDSGGVQEETSVLGVPCLTVRPNTERPITIRAGTNVLVELADILPAVDRILSQPPPSPTPISLWDGNAGTRISQALVDGHESAWTFMKGAGSR